MSFVHVGGADKTVMQDDPASPVLLTWDLADQILRICDVSGVSPPQYQALEDGIAVDRPHNQSLINDLHSYLLEVNGSGQHASLAHPPRRRVARIIEKLVFSSQCLPTSLFKTEVTLCDREPFKGGAFGDIFRASFEGRLVALKRLRVFAGDENPERFTPEFCHEAILWQRLRHKNVLPFLGIDNTSFSPHLCMMSPWMRNGNVLDYIRAARPGYVDVVRLLAEIAEGLAYLHSEHVIHGDVRGVNVLVDDQGHAMLADFGLAKISSNTATAHTTKGHGAPNWLSPELLQPKEGFHRTTASDVYSLACLGLELFTGKPPFADIRPPVNVALMVLKGEQPKRPRMSECFRGVRLRTKLWTLLCECWKADPSERPSTEVIVARLSDMVVEAEESQSIRTLSRRSKSMVSMASSNRSRKAPRSKLGVQDTLWSVLPAALRKYKITDSWRNWAMFIVYGPTGKRVERCLNLNDKPLMLFYDLKARGEDPVFMLRHMKDIDSPITIASRKKSGNEDAQYDLMPLTPQDIGVPVSSLVGFNVGGDLSAEPSTPMLGDSFSTNSSPPCFADTIVESPQAESPSRDPSTRLSPVDSIANRRLGVAISYAIAIFPNTAENEGELDVAVGGAFVVFPQSSSWWIAQRDATGKGIFDGGDAKQGWVPAGCFLTLSVPVATAVAEARERRSPGRSGRSSSSLARTGLTNDPILPMRIESKCLPGVILEDYKKREAHELEVARDTAVLIYKRYGHWSYAVKLVSGERGWLPSWYIGKVTVEGQRNGDASLTLPLTPRIQGGDDEDGYWDVIDWQMPVVPSTPLFVESSVAPIVGSTRSAASSRIIVTGKENLKAEVTRTARVAKRAVLVPSAKSTRKARREFSITSAQVLLSA